MHKFLNSPRDTSAWIISGTTTYRLGCRMLMSNRRKDLPNTNIGGNRANIEKSMREVWQADDGYLLCQVDQEGAEALIVSYLCRNAKYRSLFLNNIKPHTYLGLKLFKARWKQDFLEKTIDDLCVTPIPELNNTKDFKLVAEMIKDSDKWKPKERYYHFAKKTIHAGSYGMMGNTFRLQMLKESGGLINLTSQEADAFLMGFHTEFPEIREWHHRVYEAAKIKKVLRNLFGFPYNITDFVNEHDYKDLIAWVPQSTVACITRQAYINLQEYIELNKKQWHLLNDNHDSYMAEAPKEEIFECAKVMKSFLEIELKSPFDGSLFRMKAEASFGTNWGPAKESNLEGLKAIKI